MADFIVATGFTDGDMSIAEWIAFGYAERFLVEIGEKHGVKITEEQAED